MASHLYIEIQFICITFFAVLLYRVMKVDDRRTSQLYFRVLLASCIVCFTFDLAQAVVGSLNPAAHVGLLYFFNIMYYIALGAECYYWFLYSESEQDSFLAASRRMRIYVAMPFLIIALMAITAPFNHALFYIDDQGVYHRGPLHFVQVVISYAYMFITSIKAFVLAHKASNYATRHHLFITGSLIIPTAITAVLQAFLPNLPILCAGCCDSLLFGYLAMQEEHVSVDPLTKVNNRRRMLHDLEAIIKRAREEHLPFGLLIIDVDKFKGINDTYGHVEGDNALIHIAQALGSVKGTGLRVYRYGGDEFIMTSEDSSEATLDRVAKDIQMAVMAESESMGKPYKLSVSVGYTKFELTDIEPSDIVSRADSKLYEEKHAKNQPVPKAANAANAA